MKEFLRLPILRCLFLLAGLVMGGCGADAAPSQALGDSTGGDADASEDVLTDETHPPTSDAIGETDVGDAPPPDRSDDAGPDSDLASDTGGDLDLELSDAPVAPEYPLDDVLRFNHIQMKGTHNSYHIEPDFVAHPSWRYTHSPLPVQLSDEGVRNFEIDVHWNEEMGFLVHHLPIIDQQTVCETFVECLQDLKTWSDDHPGHHPLVVFVEPKDDIDVGAPITGHFDDLEAEILSVWPIDRLVTPAEVQGESDTLREAVTERGWPTLGTLRNRLFLVLLDSGDHRDEYLEVGIENRLMFTDSSPDAPYAAFLAWSNPLDDEARYLEMVEAGFVVRARTDSVDGDEAPNNDRTRFDAALRVGAHFIVTDFPFPVEDREYWVDLPMGRPSLCNPITAPEDCEPHDIEGL